MGIFNAIASAALLAASAGWSDAFAPTIVGSFQPTSGALCRREISNTILCAATEDSSSTPCEAPSDVEAAILDNASALRNALVTNIKGEIVPLGDAMATSALSAKTYDTSVVVFLRHMG